MSEPEPDGIQFHGPVTPSGGRSRAARAGVVAGAGLVVLVGVVAAMGAAPSPATGADPSASAAPAASADPNTTPPKRDRAGWRGLDIRRGDLVGRPFRDITITAINGSNLALETDDGWTRTIAVTDATTITKGGATIAVGDLAVGDQIRFAQQRQDDGSYTVTRIVVVLPTVAGEVTAVDGSTITITERGGTTQTIHVDGDTRYRVDGADGSLSDIKVGSIVVAEGTQRADGSLDASIVGTGFDRLKLRGPDLKRDRANPPDTASPEPSSGS